MLTALHAHGVDFNLRDMAHRSALFDAVESDDGSELSRQTIGMLIEGGALVDITDCTGRTPLYVAVRAGNEPLAHFLLDEGDANPNLFATNAEMQGAEEDSMTEETPHTVLQYEKRLVDGLA